MIDRLSHGEVEDSYTYAACEQHSEVGNICELRLIIRLTKLQLRVLREQDNQKEDQTYVLGS